MPDTHDERGGDEAALRNIDDVLADENLDAHRISASIAAAIRQLRWELKLAIAHDRQPYPTAEAYDRACAALNKCRERAKKAEAGVVRQLRAAFAAGWHAHDDHTAVALATIRRDDRENAAKAWVREFMADAEATDVAQDGLSATEAAGDGGQGSGDARTPERAAAGPSGVEGECPWCGILQKLDADGLTVEHRRFNGTKCPGATRRPNDTTEDGQHG